eukprot:tig00000254_g22506.t1
MKNRGGKRALDAVVGAAQAGASTSALRGHADDGEESRGAKRAKPADWELERWRGRIEDAMIRTYTTTEQFSEAERLRDGRFIHGSWHFEQDVYELDGVFLKSLAVIASVDVRGLVVSTHVDLSLGGRVLAAECSCEETGHGLLCSHATAVLLCVTSADGEALVPAPQEAEEDDDDALSSSRRDCLLMDLAACLWLVEGAVRNFRRLAECAPKRTRTACPVCDANAVPEPGFCTRLKWCAACGSSGREVTERHAEPPLCPLLDCIKKLHEKAANFAAEGELEKAARLVEVAAARLSAVVPAEHGSLPALARALTGLLAVPACHPEAPDALRQRCLEAAEATVKRLEVDGRACPGLNLCRSTVGESSDVVNSILAGSLTGSEAVESLKHALKLDRFMFAQSLDKQVHLRFECLLSIRRYVEAERLARAAENGAWLTRVARARGDGRRSALHALSPDLYSSAHDLRALAAEYRKEDPLAAFLLLARAARELHRVFFAYDLQETCEKDKGLSRLFDKLVPATHFTPFGASTKEAFAFRHGLGDPWASHSLTWAMALLNVLACAVDVTLNFVKSWLAPGTAPEGFLGLFQAAGRSAGKLAAEGGEAAVFERLTRTEGSPYQVATNEARALVMLEACAAVVTEFGRNVPGAWRAAEAFVQVGQPALALSVASGTLRRHSRCASYETFPVGEDESNGFSYLFDLLKRWATKPPGSLEAQARAAYLAGGLGATSQGLFAHADKLYVYDDADQAAAEAGLRACRAALDFAVSHRDADGNHSDVAAVLSEHGHWCESRSLDMRSWALGAFKHASDAAVIATLTDPLFAPEHFAGDAGFQVKADQHYKEVPGYRDQGRTVLAAELAAYCARVESCSGMSTLEKSDCTELLRHLAEAATDPALPAATRERAMASLPAAVRLSLASRRPSAADEYLQRAVSGVPEDVREERLKRAWDEAYPMFWGPETFRRGKIPTAVALSACFSTDDDWWLTYPSSSADLASYYARLEKSSENVLVRRWTILGLLIKAGDDESIPSAARAAGEAALPPAVRGAIAARRSVTAADVLPDLLQGASVEAQVERGIGAAARGTSALALCAALLAPPPPPPSAAASTPPPPPPPAGGDLLRLAEAAARRAIELGGAAGLRPFPEPESMLESDVKAVAAAADAIVRLACVTPEGALALFRLVPHWRFLEAARAGRPPASPAFVAERDAALMEHWPSAVGRAPPALLELLFESLFRFGLGLHVAPYARAVARGRPTLQLLARLLRGYAASKDRPIAFLPLLTEHPVADHDLAPGPATPGDWPPLRAFLAETFKRGFERGAKGDALLQMPTAAPEASLGTKKRLYTGYMDLLWMVAAVDAPLACELSRPVLREAVAVLGLHMEKIEGHDDNDKQSTDLCGLFAAMFLRAGTWHWACCGGCGPESEWHRLLCELKGTPHFEALKDKCGELDVRGRWALRTAQEREEDGDDDEGDNWCRGGDDWPREEEEEEEDS